MTRRLIPWSSLRRGTFLAYVRRAVLLVAVACIGFAAPGQSQSAPSAPTAATNSIEAHLGRGYEALRTDQFETAVTEFRAALKLDPSLVTRARFPLAVALFNLRQTAEARTEFEAVHREIGDHPNILYYIGRLDLIDQNFPSAIRNLTKALDKPPFPDTVYYLGFACFKQGDLAGAEKYLKRAVENSPNDSIAWYQLGALYRKLGREPEARRAFETSANLRTRDTDESKLRMDCARALDQSPLAQAKTVCDQLYDPANVDRLTILGTLYGQHGDFDAALPLLKRAAELAPQSAQMQYNLAFTYFQMNRAEEARAPLAQAVERWPDVFPLNFLYGAVLARLGEDALAYDALERARRLNEKDTRTVQLLSRVAIRLGQTALLAGKIEPAFRFFHEAATLVPADPEPHRALADAYAAAGKTTEAEAERQRADQLSAVPANPR